MVKRDKDVSASLTSVCDGVKQKTGCALPQAKCGVHIASRRGRKARCARHLTSSRLRDAVPRWRATCDGRHCPRRRKRNAFRIGRRPSGTTRDAGGMCHRALARRRAAGRAELGP